MNSPTVIAALLGALSVVLAAIVAAVIPGRAGRRLADLKAHRKIVADLRDLAAENAAIPEGASPDWWDHLRPDPRLSVVRDLIEGPWRTPLPEEVPALRVGRCLNHEHVVELLRRGADDLARRWELV